MVQKLIWLAIAGACGTVSRYTLCELAGKVKGCPAFVGTFSVNILGSFLFGLIYVLATKKFNISPETRFIILTGFMGAFTTFSTFAFDTAKLIRAEEWMMACGNVFGQIVLGLGALAVGVIVGRMV